MLFTVKLLFGTQDKKSIKYALIEWVVGLAGAMLYLNNVRDKNKSRVHHFPKQHSNKLQEEK